MLLCLWESVLMSHLLILELPIVQRDIWLGLLRDISPANLCRYRGANSYHNSNRMTFMRVPAWRSMLAKPGGSAPYLRTGTVVPCSTGDACNKVSSK